MLAQLHGSGDNCCKSLLNHSVCVLTDTVMNKIVEMAKAMLKALTKVHRIPIQQAVLASNNRPDAPIAG